ncbi:MAG TPA: nucleoside monophosphate kinase [Candidatus Paceibacterota bacterium]|nr:nucleoside monophosphate kinase [Candidatus Paceibacterota bacterium]
MNYKTVLLMGLPGSGKGTQAKLLAERLGWKHFSTGDVFKELRNGTGPLAEKVKETYDNGRYAPDWFATYLFEDTMLNLPADQGVVCDGYPRTLAQAEIFDDTLDWLGRPYLALNLAVREDEALRRQIERAKVEHRPDSATPEQVKIRFEQYQANTEPLLNYFREKGVLGEINGEETPEEVAAAIAAALQQ